MRMEMFPENKWSLIVLLLMLCIAGVMAYESNNMSRRNADLANNLAREIARLELEQQEISARLADALGALGKNLDLTKSQQEALRSDLLNEKKKADVIEEQLGKVSGTVSTLEKLSKTDEELLQKYSKVYFLNEHYIPARLSRILPAYGYDTKTPKRELQIHTSVLPYLKAMMDAADKAAGEDLLAASAYRSFDTQGVLKSHYTVVYGSGANTFSADQGYSEHQLGTTVDFTTTALGTDSDGFASTKTYAWLTAHAHEYGFTLSYPQSNAYYKFEPWHWRFVGKELAAKLYADGKHFYDLDQRTIDAYLVNIFD